MTGLPHSDAALEGLLDQRDHLRIQVSLAEEGNPHAAGLRDLRARLRQLESEIAQYGRAFDGYRVRAVSRSAKGTKLD